MRYTVILRSKHATITSTVEAPHDKLAEDAAEALRQREDAFHPGEPTTATVGRDYAAIKVDESGEVLERVSLFDGTYEPLKQLHRSWKAGD